MIRRRMGVAAALVAVMVATPLTLGAASAPGMRDAGICIPLIYCPQPTPTPTPTTPGTPTTPTTPVLPIDPTAPVDPSTPVVPSDPQAPQAPVEPVEAPVDAGAPVFTGTPASMGSESLSFTGLSGISIVSVPTVDGGSIRALKISADSITIKGFSLTVRPPDGPGLVTTADTMSLQGDVSVYIGSISASSMGGAPLTIGTDTPPPLTDVEPGLLNVSMGLVGSIADLITYSNTDQRIVEAE
ncbi:hypothetical protein ACI3KT_12155 [Microbacterium sp. ZW T6_19]|uniref:hypothetical protein n=1 Tax=Microbacterium sp. ZW T6_19 TaxID=3378082 RepID=UPI003852730D